MYNSLEKKSKSTGKIRGTFFKILGKSSSRKFLSLVVKRRCRKDVVTFPINVTSVKQIIIILPEERLQALYQLKNVISLISIFKHAAIILLCEHSIAPILGMIPGLDIIEYDVHDRAGFRSTFLNLSHQFMDNVDICFLLDHNPELAIQYFTASTGAPVRIGYEDSSSYPFLNIRVRPSTIKKYLPDWNCSISQMFGRSEENLRWSVAKKTVEEVEHLLKESGIKNGSRLGGIDGSILIQMLGNERTVKLIQSIVSLGGLTWYLYIENEEQNSSLIRQCNLPTLVNFTVSRAAALATLSEIVITGNTLLYGLATLLDISAIGFFTQDDIDLYCPQSSMLHGLVILSDPDTKIAECLQLIRGKLNL